MKRYLIIKHRTDHQCHSYSKLLTDINNADCTTTNLCITNVMHVEYTQEGVWDYIFSV